MLALNHRIFLFFLPQNTEFEEFNNQRAGPEAGRNWRNEERVTDYPAQTETQEKTQGKGTNGRQVKGGLGTEKHTKAPEGTTTGALTGGIIGGTLGLLAGIGALAIPGLGPFIAAGPLMATFADLVQAEHSVELSVLWSRRFTGVRSEAI